MKNRCDQLGMCQARAQCHVSCACPAQSHYPFAPGVIEGMPTCRKHGRVEVISFYVVVLAGLAALCAVVGFALGYVSLGVL